MSRDLISWLVAGGAAVAILYFGTRRPRSVASSNLDSAGPFYTASNSDVRNAPLKYRPVGGNGEPYPDWVRMLNGKSGVYILREAQNDGTTEIVYVGESHTARLYQTLTRHFQTVRHEAQEVPMT